jgi:uncharacterized protein involved in type VI secretion and phage assembly
MTERHYGKYRGVVTDVDDPSHLGRVRARVPRVLHDVESGWALPAAPYAGPGVGAFAIPPRGAGVWIEFEAGDTSHPIWTGCWWAENHRPANHDGAKATPKLKLMRSEQGLMVSLDDGAGTVAVSDEHGHNILTLEVAKGQVTVKAASKVVVQAPRIELVEGSSHPLVLGDELLMYLNQIVSVFAAHVHTSSWAPPVTPLPPPTPQLISTRVTTG